MKINRIYAGTWVPRNILHLQEFYTFLKTGNSHLHLNKEYLKELHKALHLTDIQYEKSLIDSISAKINDMDFNFLEDGTLLVSVPGSNNVKKDFEKISGVLLNRILKSFTYLYSKGAPVPKIFNTIESVMPLIISATTATTKEVDNFFIKFADIPQHTIKDHQLTAYFGTKLIVLVGKTKHNINLIRYLIYLQDYNSQLEKLLNIHRTTWDEISTIREQKQVQFKDLPVMRDQLLDVNKDISFFYSRLKQMDKFTEKRKQVLDNLLPKGKMKEYCDNELSSMITTQHYLQELWEMTQNYATTTLELVSLLYQDNEQREINLLQIIFIIGVIASLLTLGAMPTTDLITRDLDGRVLSMGTFSHFSFTSMLQFGAVALVTSVVLYFSLHWIFTNLKRFRVIDTSSKGTLSSSIRNRLKS